PPEVDGHSWLDPDYPDAGWSAGPAPLGFAGSSPQTMVETQTQRWVGGGQWGPIVNTTYFRHEFYLEAAEDIAQMTMEILRDDGVVIYLNGVELLRENMPEGSVSYHTEASTIVGGADHSTYFTRV